MSLYNYNRRLLLLLPVLHFCHAATETRRRHDTLRSQSLFCDLISITRWCFSILVLPLTFLFAIRTIYLLHSVRKIRRMKDPRETSCRLSPSTQPLKTLVVLGSGGHTSEMLDLLRNLNPDRYGPIILVVAKSDTTSLQRVRACPHPLLVHDKDIVTNARSKRTRKEQQVYRIPRSREVGQSYLSSIFTTFYSFLFAFWLLGSQVQPDLVLVNGPGTCLPIAIASFIFRIIGWMPETKIVFVESFCRVTSLSLTGKILYPIADLFVVCWEQLHDKYPLTYLVTSFIRNTKRRKD